MGATEDATYEYNNIRKVTVNSFFMDETEVANVHYRIFIGQKGFLWNIQILRSILPDTLCWR
jgi:formylglycine-generating enzyme required for sulfatase activity